MTRIEVRGLTKRYGPDTVVDDLTFTVEAGQVTGFLGPNGAGKTTTMRMIVGLAAPDRGTATIGGRHYGSLPVPLTEVGALLDAAAVHGGRTARDHLLALAASNGLPPGRVEDVLTRTGMAGVAVKRAGTFSLGMRQRLGIAAALLGDPRVLIFDEPVNGLDPEGIRWARELMRALAAEGRAVLVSSHLMSEMAQTADHLIVIGRGRIIADTPASELTGGAGGGSVRVRAADPGTLALRLSAAGATVREGLEASLTVAGMSAEEIGRLAAYHGLALIELSPVRASLEDAYLRLTSESVEFQGVAA
ncbi:ABC transporter ATP-binding protein [Actinoplanes couchii]|uniref:Multidrug ABC transporter ATP-binding protein n=1 Tax=Actinoplanes couchii TaxID=403638 RepID=A0ABQ3XS03_9ACTN|nr:ATP-binding cassette domain-containing protein [Actinoplanes couchii]MDR6318757.1 ABC-2 type transport system ATP-binding protein [Actinoplanes couchii]GID61285.1 multidrug ABC transporter ATP-binding protein [Actinoplanes couchii]